MAHIPDRLAAILRSTSGEIRLAEAALLIAQQNSPGLQVEHYLCRIDAFQDHILSMMPVQPHLGDRIFALNTFLFDEMGFTLQEQASQRNPGYLHRLLDLGEGDATSLLILYLELGRRIGMVMDGLSFSGHPLVRVCHDDREIVIDPLAGGLTMLDDQFNLLLQQVCGERCHCEAQPETVLPLFNDREILIRMLRSLKAFYLRQMAFDKALWAIDTILSISPAATTELRDRAAIYVTLGYTRAAVTDYCHYLDQQPDAHDVAEVRRSLGQLLDQPVTLH